MFIDYQNVHWTGYENYAPWNDKPYQHLIHPAHFADEAARRWEEDHGAAVSVTEIHVYRGLPDSRKEGRLNSYVMRQHVNWVSGGRVVVHARPLRYPRGWPDDKAQEKGVDVMLALDVVRASLAKACDLVLVASRDTDQLPAIEMAAREHPRAVGIVSWAASGALKANPPVPTVLLDAESFRRSRDTTTY